MPAGQVATAHIYFICIADLRASMFWFDYSFPAHSIHKIDYRSRAAAWQGGGGAFEPPAISFAEAMGTESASGAGSGALPLPQSDGPHCIMSHHWCPTSTSTVPADCPPTTILTAASVNPLQRLSPPLPAQACGKPCAPSGATVCCWCTTCRRPSRSELREAFMSASQPSPALNPFPPARLSFDQNGRVHGRVQDGAVPHMDATEAFARQVSPGVPQQQLANPVLAVSR